MESLIKENTIFESVKEKSESFLCDNPLLDTYKRKEIDEYFNKRMLDYEINKAKNEGLEEGRLKGLKEGRLEGLEEGRIEGLKESQIIIARNLKKSGIDINIIRESTGLSIEEIEKL